MKKIITVSTFIAIVVLSIAFISCGSSGDGTPVGNLDNNNITDYQIKLSENTLTVDFEAVEKQVQLTTSKNCDVGYTFLLLMENPLQR